MDAARKQRAQQLLFQASQDASIAIDHARRGRNIEALRAWRALFGPKSVSYTHLDVYKRQVPEGIAHYSDAFNAAA